MGWILVLAAGVVDRVRAPELRPQARPATPGGGRAADARLPVLRAGRPADGDRRRGASPAALARRLSRLVAPARTARRRRTIREADRVAQVVAAAAGVLRARVIAEERHAVGVGAAGGRAGLAAAVRVVVLEVPAELSDGAGGIAGARRRSGWAARGVRGGVGVSAAARAAGAARACAAAARAAPSARACVMRFELAAPAPENDGDGRGNEGDAHRLPG